MERDATVAFPHVIRNPFVPRAALDGRHGINDGEAGQNLMVAVAAVEQAIMELLMAACSLAGDGGD